MTAASMSPGYLADCFSLETPPPSGSFSVIESLIQALKDAPPPSPLNGLEEEKLTSSSCDALQSSGAETALMRSSFCSSNPHRMNKFTQQHREHFGHMNLCERNDREQYYPCLASPSADAVRTFPSSRREEKSSTCSIITSRSPLLQSSFSVTRSDDGEPSVLQPRGTSSSLSKVDDAQECLMQAASDSLEIATLESFTQCLSQKRSKNSDEDIELCQLRAQLLAVCREPCGKIETQHELQEFLNSGSPKRIAVFCEQLLSHVVPITLSSYGCRVIQKLLSIVPLPLAIQVAKQLHGRVIQCVRDPNGNHVIQKCIEVLPFEEQSFVLHEIDGKVPILALHSFGCRILQRLLERWSWNLLTPYLEELLSSIPFLVVDRFGNYVVQHLLEYGDVACKSEIVAELTKDVALFGRHKFASNVLEKVLTCCSKAECKSLISAAISAISGTKDKPLLLLMSCNRYGNYVVQRMLQVAEPEEVASILTILVPHLPHLKRFFCGRYIANIVEQYVHDVSISPAYSITTPSSSLDRPIFLIDNSARSS